MNGILIGCIYLPNGNPQPGPKFDYKLAWFKRLPAHARKLLREGVPVVLAGDYNVAPTEIDIYPTRSWDDDALVQPASRAAYARLVKQGWTDAIGHAACAKSASIRSGITCVIAGSATPDCASIICLLSPALARRLQAAGVDRSCEGEGRARAIMRRFGSNSGRRKRQGDGQFPGQPDHTGPNL